MAAVINQSFIDNAIKLSKSGMSIDKIAKHFGVNRKTVRRAFLLADFKSECRNASYHKPDNLTVEEIVDRYRNGESVLQLSKLSGLSRFIINSYISKAGVGIRNSSEASFVKNSRMTKEERLNQAKAAHDAVRGKKRTKDELIRRAITRGDTPSIYHIGIGEELLTKTFRSLGADVIEQKPVDKYIIDLIVNGVAVEVKHSQIGGTIKSKRLEKTKYLLNAGFPVIWLISDGDDDIIANAEYMLSCINIASTDPSKFSKYWVMRSRMDNFTRIRNDLGQFSVIPTPPKPFASFREFDACP